MFTLRTSYICSWLPLLSQLAGTTMIWNINKLDNLFLLLKIAFNPFVHCTLLGGDNTDLPSDSNISKMLRVSIAFNCFLMVCTLLDFGLVVLKIMMFKVLGIIDISKIEFLNICGTERVDVLYTNFCLGLFFYATSTFVYFSPIWSKLT